MPRRHPVPTLWLMTDERLGEGLWDAVARLPRGSGVIFRHYATPLGERRALFARLGLVARRRGLVLVRAGSARLARREDGVHNGVAAHGLSTRSAHRRSDVVAACRAGADAVFVSPVYPTRSHPGARALGPVRAAAIGRALPIAIIALGGMDGNRFRRLRGLGFHGWAAIDAWGGAGGRYGKAHSRTNQAGNAMQKHD